MAEPVTPLTLPRVNQVAFRLHTGPVHPPNGIIYSTNPQCYCDDDNHSYIVKGPEIEIVAAEAVSYLLASSVGVKTPKFAIGTIPELDGCYFGSRVAEAAIRDAEPFLMGFNRGQGQQLLQAFSAVHAFDIWVANTDRNMGGFLIERERHANSLIAIDFERACAIRGPHPIIETGSLNPRSLRPVGILSHIPHPWLEQSVDTITRLDDHKIVTAIAEVRLVLGEQFAWSEAVERVLLSRKSQLRAIAKEVWS